MVMYCNLLVMYVVDVYLLSWVVVFFFKQKTAYEMRISDWSSDVCSSDLDGRCFPEAIAPFALFRFFPSPYDSRSHGIRVPRWLSMPGCTSILDWRSTSAIRRAPGNAAQMKIPTAC